MVELLLNRNCQDIGNILVGPTPYQTNINTPKPWILGGITYNDLVKDYVSRATTNNNVTNCGLNTPFWTGLKCVSCNEPTPVFDIFQAKCVACPAGNVFDPATRSCIPSGVKSYKPNPVAEPTILLPAGSPADSLKKYMNTGVEPCPADKPIVKDNACILCPKEKPYFSLITKECQGCDTGFIFDSKTHICIKGTPIATDVTFQTPHLVMNTNSTDTDWNNY